MDDNAFTEGFYNPENELDNKYSNIINMHKLIRGTRKCDIIIQGFNLKTKEEINEFISLVKRKFGINGCHKMMEDIDKNNKVFIFTGNKRDEIKDLLVTNYGKDDEFIKYFG